MTMPMTLAERKTRRDQVRKNLLAKAEVEARAVYRSIKCGSTDGHYEGWRHASDPDGCKNDGSNCLCECHDPQPAVVASGGAR